MRAHQVDAIGRLRAKFALCVAVCLTMGWAQVEISTPAVAQSNDGGTFVIDDSVTFSDPEPTPEAPAAPLESDATFESNAAAGSATNEGELSEGSIVVEDEDPFAGVDCSPDAFATVVDSAGSTLRAMNGERAPRFQAMLRVLKSRRGWDDETFIAKARIYVEDDQITAYDETGAQLLAKINSLGGDGSDEAVAGGPDCELLAELEGHLEQLVQTIDAKWAYMFTRVEAALSD